MELPSTDDTVDTQNIFNRPSSNRQLTHEAPPGSDLGDGRMSNAIARYCQCAAGLLQMLLR